MTRETGLAPVMQTVVRRIWERGRVSCDEDVIVIETPVALVYNGISHVVMMATPADLEDLALGFSLSEGIVQGRDEMLDLEVFAREQGIEERRVGKECKIGRASCRERV